MVPILFNYPGRNVRVAHSTHALQTGADAAATSRIKPPLSSDFASHSCPNWRLIPAANDHEQCQHISDLYARSGHVAPLARCWHLLGGLFALMLIGLAGLAAVTGWEETKAQLARLSLVEVTVLLTLSLVNYFFRAIRWHIFARCLGLRNNACTEHTALSGRLCHDRDAGPGRGTDSHALAPPRNRLGVRTDGTVGFDRPRLGSCRDGAVAGGLRSASRQPA